MKRLYLIFVVQFICVTCIAQLPKYKIVSQNKDNRGLVNQLMIYVPKMSDIKVVNKILLDRYKNNYISTLQIFYFDNASSAQNYMKLLFNKNTSDSQVEKLSQHVTGKFEYIKYDNTQSLHIGKGSDNY